MTIPPPHRILLVTGLKREARIIGGGAARVIIGGGSSARLAQDLEQAAAQGVGGILSMGVAGGLAPGVPPGVVIIASAVAANEARIGTTTTWADHLRRAVPDSLNGDIAGVDTVIAEVSGKAALRRMTGAAAVDMESHIAARIAQRHGIPFAVLRVIADPAERSLPPAAQAGFDPDGSINIGAVVHALFASPAQTLALIKTAQDAGKAFRALSRCRRLIGPAFCLPDFGQLLLDVP